MVSLPKKSFLGGEKANASLQLGSGADYSRLLDDESVESKTGGNVGLRDALQQDIDDILALGVVLKTNSPVKDPRSLLKQGYDAVCLATGISASDHTLGVEGEEAEDGWHLHGRERHRCGIWRRHGRLREHGHRRGDRRRHWLRIRPGIWKHGSVRAGRKGQ